MVGWLLPKARKLASMAALTRTLKYTKYTNPLQMRSAGDGREAPLKYTDRAAVRHPPAQPLEWNPQRGAYAVHRTVLGRG